MVTKWSEIKREKGADRFGYPRPAPKPSETKKKRGPKPKEDKAEE